NGMKARGPLFGRQAIPGVGIVFEARGHLPARKSIQAIGSVDAIGAPEDQGNAPWPCVFKYMNGAKAVIGDVKKGIRITGNHGGLRTGVTDQSETGWEIGQIFGVTHVAVKKRNAALLENSDIFLAASAHQIVHHSYFVARLAEMQSHV